VKYFVFFQSTHCFTHVTTDEVNVIMSQLLYCDV